jgi:thioredoxin 2
MVAPEVKRTAQELSGKAVVLKVDTEAHPDLARRYNIQSIPNFIVFAHGNIVRQEAGAVNHAVLRRWLEESG